MLKSIQHLQERALIFISLAIVGYGSLWVFLLAGGEAYTDVRKDNEQIFYIFFRFPRLKGS